MPKRRPKKALAIGITLYYTPGCVDGKTEIRRLGNGKSFGLFLSDRFLPGLGLRAEREALSGGKMVHYHWPSRVQSSGQQLEGIQDEVWSQERARALRATAQ